jgi:hypothetical protein
MSQNTAPESQSDADRMEVAADQAIAVCGGDIRAALKALIVANEFLESEVSELMKAVSRAYVRGRFHTYSGWPERASWCSPGRRDSICFLELTAWRAIAESHVQPLAQKYFHFPLPQITSPSIVIPHPQEGRIAIVTDVGSGRRWTQAAPKTRALSADGEVVWSWRPDAGVKLVKVISLATVANKPGHRGEREISC